MAMCYGKGEYQTEAPEQDLKVARITRYMCCICGKEYNAEEDAQVCYCNHKKPIRITYRYDRDDYPVAVDIGFMDREIRYERTDEDL